MLTDPFRLVGTIVDGRYRVERLAGQGGFGVVYQAYHLAFEGPIALKVLKLPEHWDSERRAHRIKGFQREGRMLFELSRLHPAIVRAFETGVILGHDGASAPYLALEWLDGISLDRALKARRNTGLAALALPEVLRLLDGPARGLAVAHARGVVHRDIKPANLFALSPREAREVKILDFGIAKLVDSGVSTTAQLALTSGATASFTPMYAAPEQWLERLGATGPWTDVHALALVCAELLTGSAPLRGREPAQFMAACLDASVRPTPHSAGARLPPPVEAVFARAVALDPRERFRDIGAFWRALCGAAGWSPADAPAHVELSTPAASPPETEGAADDEGARPTANTRRGTVTTASSANASFDTNRAPATRRARWLAVSLAALGLFALLVFRLQGSPRRASASGDVRVAPPVPRQMASALTMRPESLAKPASEAPPVSVPSVAKADTPRKPHGPTPTVRSHTLAREPITTPTLVSASPGDDATKEAPAPAASAHAGVPAPLSDPPARPSATPPAGADLDVDDPALVRRRPEQIR